MRVAPPGRGERLPQHRRVALRKGREEEGKVGVGERETRAAPRRSSRQLTAPGGEKEDENGQSSTGWML